MRRRQLSVVSAVSVALALAIALGSARERPAGPGAPPAAQQGEWTLAWSDEFDGPDGSGIDRTKWVPETGGNGWGNNELEYYRDDVRNASQQGGNLAITAAKERYTGPDGVSRDYTSARLKTAGVFSQRYGRFEARIKVPEGQGIWPAFWMLGDNIGRVGWPACGEIDIMENIGREPSTAHGTIHGPGYSGASGIGAAVSVPDGQRLASDFHVFAVEWEPRVIRWYFDDTVYETRTPADLPSGTRWVFDHPFFIILNLAVGGGWPGNPDATTVFPQTMLVDYVRVYQRPSPEVVACNPASGSRGTTLDVRVTGTRFADGATVSFGPKVKVLSTTLVSAAEIVVRLKIKKRAEVGPRDVTVTNPDGTSGVAAGAFVLN